MAELVGIGISGMITPGGNDENTYATHSDLFGKGGYRAVQTIEERDAISYERRALGMEVRVLETGIVYYLEAFEGSSKKGVTSQVWKVATAPSEGGDNESTGGGEKEIFSGYLRDGKFWQEDETGTPVEIEGKVGCIYLDTDTGITYRFVDSKKSFEKINPMSWIDVE